MGSRQWAVGLLCQEGGEKLAGQNLPRFCRHICSFCELWQKYLCAGPPESRAVPTASRAGHGRRGMGGSHSRLEAGEDKNEQLHQPSGCAGSWAGGGGVGKSWGTLVLHRDTQSQHQEQNGDPTHWGYQKWSSAEWSEVTSLSSSTCLPREGSGALAFDVPTFLSPPLPAESCHTTKSKSCPVSIGASSWRSCEYGDVLVCAMLWGEGQSLHTEPPKHWESWAL